MSEVVAAPLAAVTVGRDLGAVLPGGGRFLPPRDLEARVAAEDNTEARDAKASSRGARARATRRPVLAAIPFLVHLLAQQQGELDGTGSDFGEVNPTSVRQGLQAYRAASEVGLEDGEQNEDGVVISRRPQALDIRI